MTTINITITDSEEQIIDGLPKSITLTTNVPTSIHYTLNGQDPTVYSYIYVSPIIVVENAFTLKVMATDGTDFSDIVSKTYGSILQNDRLPHSATDAPAQKNQQALYPFGTGPNAPNGQYLNPGDAGVNVDDPNFAQIPSGYDGSGNTTGFSNKPYTLENYSITYSTGDAEGNVFPGSGNMPAETTIQIPSAPPEETDVYTNLFDPRALVIFQDVSKENPMDPPHINREFFSLEDPQKARDGNAFFSSGLDEQALSGSFVNSHFNSRTNEITYYYHDSLANKWIISKMPYVPSNEFNMASGMVMSRHAGAGVVYQWIPYARRILF